jgi:hypothetical protein
MGAQADFARGAMGDARGYAAGLPGTVEG